MVDPVSLVSAILAVVKLITRAAATSRQNKRRCNDLAERANTLANVLRNSTYAAAKDADTARVLKTLKEALDEALTLIESCQAGGMLGVFSHSQKAADLDVVNGRINDCITDLKFIRDSSTHHHVETAATGSYYQAQGGGASSVCVGIPVPQQATVNVQWIPGPSPYHAPPAPSGYNIPPSFYTLPTVNKIFDCVRNGFR